MRRELAAAGVVAAAALGGCGSGDEGAVVVSAASSLRVALRDVPDTRMSFAGSDELAAQIRQGAKVDVFVAADEELPRRLFAEGRVERPVAIATNRLVVAVPRGGARVRALGDLGQPGVRIVVGAPGVPVGAAARRAIGGLGPGRGRALLANVVSEEPDVAGVVGKVAQRAADAGFVYATDVRATPRLRALALPDRVDPTVTYAAAVVRGARRARRGRALVRSLLREDLARRLRRAGFGPAPGARP